MRRRSFRAQAGCEDLVTTGLGRPSGLALGYVLVEARPDLLVWASIRGSYLTPGESFTLSVKVRNRGTEQAAATTLHYYRSGDATIDTTDTQLGTAAVNSLASLADADRAYSIDLTAPTSTAPYYYGACVESVAGERNTDNNCSNARVTVRRPSLPLCVWGMRLFGGESCRRSDGEILTCPSNSICTVYRPWKTVHK